MAAERLSMRKTREVLRHRWELRCSYRQIKRALGAGSLRININERCARRSRRLELGLTCAARIVRMK
jgi:hypothetical protein